MQDSNNSEMSENFDTRGDVLLSDNEFGVIDA